MKLRRSISTASTTAFTLPEMMIAVTILVIVIGGILSANIFGLRMFQMNKTKLTATEWSRKTFNQISDEVRAGNVVEIGNVDSTNSSFVSVLSGEPQQGNALAIYTSSTNTSNYILYFLNTADQTFRRTTDKAGSTLTLANSVTNTLVFSAEDFFGNTLTNITSTNSPVIKLSLEFYHPQSYLQDDTHQYKLETSMTRRALQ